MFEFVNYSADKLQPLLLTILRASGVFVLAPILSDREVPKLVKAGLLLLLCFVTISVADFSRLPVSSSVWSVAGMALHEFMIGLAIGLVFRLVFYAVHTAGAMIGYQMGFAVVTEYDANFSDQVSTLGQLWFVVATLVFLAIDGHHLLIAAFVDSYRYLPAGAAITGGTWADLLIKHSAYVFVIALKIASPVIVTLLLVDVALGTIARTMPSLNVFFIGIPIKVGAGLLVMALALPAASYVLHHTIGYFDTQIRVVFRAMGGA